MTGRSSGKATGKSHPLASDFLVELLMATLDKTTLKRTKSPKTIICTITIEKSILGKSKTFSEKLDKVGCQKKRNGIWLLFVGKTT